MTSHELNQWRLVYWRIYASFGFNELSFPLVIPANWNIVLAFSSGLTNWGRHFCRRHIHMHYFEWKYMNFEIKSLKFVPEDPINYMSALVQIMARCRKGNKPLFEPMTAWLTDACVRHSASTSKARNATDAFHVSLNVTVIVLKDLMHLVSINIYHLTKTCLKME